MLGIDISFHQPQVDYAKAAAAVDFVVLKAGGSNTGDRYTDSRYHQHAAGFAEQGKPIGVYWMNGQGPVAADAHYFLANLRADTRAFIALDLEAIDGYATWSPAAAMEWFGIVHKALPKVPLLAYMNSNVAQGEGARNHDWRPLVDAGIQLWVAHFGVPAGGHVNTGPWPNAVAHQFTERGSHPGFPGLIDLNHAPRIFWEEDDMFTDQDRANLNALASGSLPNAKGYPFPARDAVQNNLEAIITLLRQVAKNDNVDEKALGEAVAGAIRPVVESALKDVAPGASAKQIADELGKRLAA
ncbi:glycoside hydrolase family 25 protein [Pseudoclavibacter sp. VKM Ac-2888]|uniref:glycoside hydrolase family 25 protein n=1 Tax=Pseudoclavibacter sp. VKM Ac-2888 TaxID=2783830 RepID=UPI00188B60DF|nr:glycoside hydrolase family 25 protein [Pseudoclavibacter sp. VKM Ac-2888]MBF4549218.1 glycoside hydrolase family 25 protein [Pseudoclavibacter sp. VKM Ac-2888]